MLLAMPWVTGTGRGSDVPWGGRMVLFWGRAVLLAWGAACVLGAGERGGCFPLKCSGEEVVISHSGSHACISLRVGWLCPPSPCLSLGRRGPMRSHSPSWRPPFPSLPSFISTRGMQPPPSMHQSYRLTATYFLCSLGLCWQGLLPWQCAINPPYPVGTALPAFLSLAQAKAVSRDLQDSAPQGGSESSKGLGEHGLSQI